MSLQVIPNQPVAFGDTRLQGCLCEDRDDKLLIAASDSVLFQFRQSTCETEGLLQDPSFQDAEEWNGWDVDGGFACYTPDNPQDILQEATFNPVVGTMYSVVITCTTFDGVGRVRVGFGGGSGSFNGTGTFTYTILAVSDEALSLTINGEFVQVCVDFAQVYEQTTDIEVSIVDLEGASTHTYDYATNPTYFDYSGAYLTVEIPYDDTWPECFTVEVYDPCDTATYTSQEFKFVDEECTILLKACNAGDGMGFGAGFAPIMRVKSKLTHPSYSYDAETEKGTNGYVNNFYASRTTQMEFRVDQVGYHAHTFLSSLPLWDHVYLAQEEYYFQANSYEPAYGDVWESYGGILMTVEPKQDALRKVRCGPDEAMGCVPPPNFLVQRTGPNNDYVLLQTGFRIKLHF